MQPRRNNNYRDEENEDSYFLNSPTNWLCQSFQPLSPSSRRFNSTSYTTTSTDYSMKYDDQESVGTATITTQNRSINFDMKQKANSAMISYPAEYENYSPSSSKIIAPNVGKLSPSSTVDVVLHSNIEDAVVLCSSDVLKMRSQYFEKILIEQEKSLSLPTTPKSEAKWRTPIVLSEYSPYEGAAFLESLHEGKGLYSRDWNLCWARLSGLWQIEDMKVEFIHQIDMHVKKLFDIVQRNHWRVNPNVFVGFKISIFRKTNGAVPAILTGFVVEGSKATPPSHVRVSFELDPTKRHLYSSLEFHGLDGDDTSSTQSEDVSTYSGMESGKNNMKQMAYSRIPQRVQAKALKTYSTADQNGIGQLEIRCHRSVSSANKIITLRELRDKIISKEEFSSDVLNGASPLIGETSEPFWIQQSPDQQWEEPDVICNCNIDKLITLEDKRILWEMISLLIEFPDYYRGIEGHSLDSSETSCRSEVSTLDTIPTLSNLSNPTELALIFHRKEYQVLWALEAPDYLPLATTQDLIRFAFCSLK